MDLPFEVGPAAKLQLLRLGKAVDVSADGCTLGAFDMLLVPKQDKPPVLTFTIGKKQVEVCLPQATELTYADILRLAHEQNAKLFSTVPTSSRSPLMLPELVRRAKAMIDEKDKRKATEVHWALVNLYLF